MSDIIEKTTEAKSVAGLTTRELLTLVLLVAGGGLNLSAPHLGDWLSVNLLPSFVAMLSGAGSLLFGLGLARVGMRLLFPWLRADQAWSAALAGSMPAAVAFVGFVVLQALALLPLAASIWR